MKTEKIYRPSQLKDGDRVNFSIISNIGIDKRNIESTVCNGELIPNNEFTRKIKYIDNINNLFPQHIQHVERIIEDEFTNIDKCKQKLFKSTAAGNQPSNRIEKYDLFSRESIETVDEVKSLLEKIVDLVEKLKKLGIKIKI